jgi:RNA polymerase sigma-70 factor (ECF subfamily)
VAPRCSDDACNVRGDSTELDLAWERRCLVRMQGGDREAFGELYRVFAPKLYREVLMPKLGHADAAEDALAETFASLLAHHRKLEVRDQSLMAWLARVAANKAVDVHRKRARAVRSLATFESLLGPLMVGVAADGDLEERQLRELATREVARVLGALNPRYRRTLELRFFEEQPRERCAELLEVTVGTFDVLLLRALRAFRRDWDSAMAVKKDER